MTVVLDARKAPLGLAYTHMTIPVAPGAFTIDFPQWIPGDHSPSGALNQMSELVVRANGKPLAWHRDQVDMYA
ncbi:MAG: peptidase M61, partial [Candidatus Eremiobacteraeota bacterium]|nr:peptidase M61 [Candidatus Eremiobacteraeota bacterium]